MLFRDSRRVNCQRLSVSIMVASTRPMGPHNHTMRPILRPTPAKVGLGRRSSHHRSRLKTPGFSFPERPAQALKQDGKQADFLEKVVSLLQYNDA